MLIVIAKSKEKLFWALRIIIILLMGTLILPKALMFITAGGFTGGISREEHPSGNPRRVERATFSKNDPSEADTWLDGLVQKLQEFYQKDR